MADCILVGASNGLSIAEGYNIFTNDERFSRHFSDFQRKYGFNSLIQGAFCHFESEGEKWSYFSRMAYHYSFNTKSSRLMQSLHELISEKPYFVVTSNTDDHFAQAGFDRQHIFEIEGSIYKIQCAHGCHNNTYFSRDIIYDMVKHETGMEIPKQYLPKCKKCGGDMQLHIPINQYFVQDIEWKNRYNDYMAFLNASHEKQLLILEFGVGINNQMIKAPFMNLAYNEPNSFYITFNKGEIYIPNRIAEKSMGIDGDLSVIIPKILKSYTGNHI